LTSVIHDHDLENTARKLDHRSENFLDTCCYQSLDIANGQDDRDTFWRVHFIDAAADIALGGGKEDYKQNQWKVTSPRRFLMTLSAAQTSAHDFLILLTIKTKVLPNIITGIRITPIIQMAQSVCAIRLLTTKPRPARSPHSPTIQWIPSHNLPKFLISREA
jgi:hypothetical protein